MIVLFAVTPAAPKIAGFSPPLVTVLPAIVSLVSVVGAELR